MLQKIKSLSLERQLFLSFSAVSALLLMLSLGITLYFDIARQSQSIDSTISSTAAYVASMVCAFTTPAAWRPARPL